MGDWSCGQRKAYRHLSRHRIGMNICVRVCACVCVYVCGFIGSRRSKWDDELQLGRPISITVKVPILPSQLPRWVKYL